MAFICAFSAVAGQPTEHRKSISAKPVFQFDQFGPSLVLKMGHDMDSVWWPSDGPKPKSLNRASIYTYDLLIEKSWRKWGNDHPSAFYYPRLMRIRQGKNILYDASVCSVHHILMKRKLMPITYGLVIFKPSFERAMEKFPHIGMAWGGCCVSPDNPKETFEWVCSDCVAAYEKYQASHQ